MEYQMIEIHADEAAVLDDFLYEAIFLPPGMQAPPREIILRPELQVYVADFGKRSGDYALGAKADGRIVGAVWARIMKDYGHISDDTPSLAVSLYPEYRGKGIGTALMQAMLCRLRSAGYQQVSLSVQKANAAVRLYRRLGFETVRVNEEEYIMVCAL